MAKNLKSLLARKLAENSQRHAEASQEIDLDLGRQHRKLAVDLITPNPYQPRITFPQQELEELAASIAEVGLLQPISVRPVGEGYQIVAGERRWRACKLLGRPSIESLVIPVEEADMAVFALVENMERATLSDYEIGKALRQIENLFPTRKKLAEALGLNREDMYRYFAFEALPESIRNRLDAEPHLLSRAAAADIKRVLQKMESSPLVTEQLNQAWQLLEAGLLEQSKISSFLLRKPPHPDQDVKKNHFGTQAFVRDGQPVGSISRNKKHWLIKLNIDALNEENEAKLRTLLEQIATGNL